MQRAYLNKTEISLILKAESNNKPHLVQVFGIKINQKEKKYHMRMRISDGCRFIKSLCSLTPDLENYDIIEIIKYKVAGFKGITVILIEELERVFTNINGIIGSPVEYNMKNPNEEAIDTTIPKGAKSVKTQSSLPESIKIDIKVGQKERVKQDKPKKVSNIYTKGVKPIKALGLHSSDWTIKVRLVRKGELRRFTREKTGESYLLPLELIDEEGTQISATLFSSGVDKYQSILKPMGCYLISNGNIKLANKKYTSVKNDYCINLDSISTIEEIPDDPVIPYSAYNFTPISKIAYLPSTTMIDVIGIVQSVGEIDKFDRQDGTQTIKKSVKLYDDTGHNIDMTLWGAAAENELEEETIYAFKGMKVSDFNGKQLNSTADMMVVKDPDDPRTKQLKEWKKGCDISEMISLTTKMVFSGDISLVAEAIKTAETLDVDPKGITCWITGSTISIKYENGFYYMGCKKCKKKTSDGFCDRCKNNNEAVPFYTFNMKISDGTDSIWVRAFGEQCEAILKKPAAEMLKLHQNDDPEFRQTFEKAKGAVIFLK